MQLSSTPRRKSIYISVFIFYFYFFKERKKECFKGGVGSAGTAGRNVEVKHEFSLMLTKKRVGESCFEMNTQSTVKIVSWNLLKALL